MQNRFFKYLCLLGMSALALVQPDPAAAQDAPETGDAPPPDAVAPAPGTGVRQSYTAADFARYAPKNALDMLVQVPGFNIQGQQVQRGLGQATGNVLFNGERPSSKSDNIETQLQRIPAANVQRIEIVDGASLDIPGLSGQVANIVFEAGGLSGQFSWQPEVRAHNADPVFQRGSVSISGKSGELEYEAGLDNTNAGHGGADGITLITAGDGSLLETRDDSWNSRFHSPKLSGRLTWNRAGGDVGHLNAHYQRIYRRYDEFGVRTSDNRPDELRTVISRENAWNFELGGDYEFALGPGRLKTIGLRRFSHEPSSVEVVSEFADATPLFGSRFTQTGDLGETIARGEYTWKMLGGDWQLAGEGAFNTLDNVAGLFVLDPDRTFVEQPFPGGSGGVSEDRYEGSLSFGRSLSDTLSFQLLVAAEHSTILQTGATGLERGFFRPKGTLSFAWKPSDDFDVALKVQRRVLQLNFYDFLARAFLNDGNQNASNNDLRPQQDWSYEGEFNKKWGPWGSSQLRLVYRDVEDKVDIIPLADGSEAVGNIPTSWAAAVIWTNTINLDPAGIKGMKVESTLALQSSSLRDPFTGEDRQWSGFGDTQANISVRHDVPETDWAWGAETNYFHNQPNYRSNQTDRMWEGPVFAGVFVEHKDLLGLTVRGRVNNIFDARSRRYRVVYDGLRGVTPIDFIEDRDRRIGPVFSLSVRGNF
ncbi:MAG: TonB-dependent receptor plug domain-containing protein [Qipengyuania sp.]